MNNIKPLKRKCSVEGCENEVMPGNYFLCKIHYKNREYDLETYNSTYGQRSYRKSMND